jgi:predicted SAM-dependent methyltransferase
VLAYLESLQAVQLVDRRPTSAEPALRRFGKIVLPHSQRVRVRLAATHAIEARERRRASQLATRQPLRLHLGSGTAPKESWINVDLVGDRVDLAWDVTRPLPFAADAVDAIFHEHLFTVLELHEGFAMMNDAHRVLRHGGVLRVGVPNAWKEMSELWPEEDAAPLPRLVTMQEVLYYPGNRSAYDVETLQFLLGAVGFVQIEERRFGDSRLVPCPDSERRREGTVYVEALK